MYKHLSKKNLGYIPALDGLRAFAIVLVMLSHANFRLFENGGIGVPVFFVLSGFLITTLLVEEFQRKNTLEFKAFYIRRTFRLFPAFYVMLLVTFFYALLFNKIMFNDILSEIIASGLYVYNISWLWGVKDIMLYHTWSLAVEEQYYIFWPILLFLFLKKGSLNGISILLVVLISFFVISTTFKLFHNNTYAIAKSIASESIFIGCLGAVLRWRGMLNFKISSLIVFFCITAIFIIGMLPCDTFNSYNPKFFAGIFAMITILYLVNTKEGFLSKIFNNKTSVFIGKISYSLYLWHLPVFKIFKFHSTLPVLVSFVGKFVVSIIFATLSWYLIEKGATRLGRKISEEITDGNHS
jgi:peptidoglycan/LPS O-acetylase OafA/YrhL